MNQTQKKFIKYLCDFVQGRQSEYTEIDSEMLYYAHAHNVEGIVFSQLRCKELENDYYCLAVLYAYRKRCIKEIEAILQENNIPFFWVKGDVCAQRYPIPALRTMGDVDLTVPLYEKQRVMELLNQAGYISDPDKSSDEVKCEWVLYKENCRIELHHALLYGQEAGELVNDDYIEYFSHCWDYIEDRRLERNYHFIYLLFHIRKHFLNKGIGIRQFMDLAFIIKNDQLDWIWIKNELLFLNMYDFASTCLGFVEQWFEVSSPLSRKLSDSFYDVSTEKILSGGVFGYDDNANYANRLSNMDDRFITRIKYIFHCLFIPYSVYNRNAKYSFLQNKKFLLPIAWLIHVFTGIKRMIKENDYWKNVLPSDERKRERRNEIKMWGL